MIFIKLPFAAARLRTRLNCEAARSGPWGGFHESAPPDCRYHGGLRHHSGGNSHFPSTAWHPCRPRRAGRRQKSPAPPPKVRCRPRPPSVPEAIAPEFAFRRLEIDTSKPQAEACLVFTRTLDDSGKTHYGDYLKFDPQIQTAVRATRRPAVHRRACLQPDLYRHAENRACPRRTAKSSPPTKPCRSNCATARPSCASRAAFCCRAKSVDGVPVTTVNIAKLKIEDAARRRPPAVAARNRRRRSDHDLRLRRKPHRERAGLGGLAGHHGGAPASRTNPSPRSSPSARS